MVPTVDGFLDAREVRSLWGGHRVAVLKLSARPPNRGGRICYGFSWRLREQSRNPDSQPSWPALPANQCRRAGSAGTAERQLQTAECPVEPPARHAGRAGETGGRAPQPGIGGRKALAAAASAAARSTPRAVPRQARLPTARAACRALGNGNLPVRDAMVFTVILSMARAVVSRPCGAGLSDSVFGCRKASRHAGGLRTLRGLLGLHREDHFQSANHDGRRRTGLQCRHADEPYTTAPRAVAPRPPRAGPRNRPPGTAIRDTRKGADKHTC